MKNFFEKWFEKRKRWASTSDFIPKTKEKLKTAPKQALAKARRFKFNKINAKKIAQHANTIKWMLIVIALYLAADMTGRVIGIFIKPEYAAISQKPIHTAISQKPTADYNAILKRNMFNVEGTIPEPFEQGLLDCLSQAKPSRKNLKLLGTIVMGNETLSTALIEEEGNPIKLAVRTNESFADGKYTALTIERRKLCFQIRATQELEFIEIKDELAGMATPALGGLSRTGHIQQIGDSQYSIQRSFLEDKLKNLTDILASAKAVPYIRNGKFQGFLIKTMDQDSLFRELGIMEGDVLTMVEDIQLDNPGKGLEAFQRLRNSPRISLELIRSGRKKSMSYDVK